MTLRVASAKRWAVPVEADGDPGERTVVVALHAGDGAGKRGAHAEVLRRPLGQGEVSARGAHQALTLT